MRLGRSLLVLVSTCVMVARQDTTTGPNTGPDINERNLVSTLPPDTAITRGNLVTTLPFWGYCYKVSLKLYIDNFAPGNQNQYGWSEVFRFSGRDEDCCTPGDRIPALLVNERGYIHVTSTVGSDGNFFTDVFVQEKTWIPIEIEQYIRSGVVYYEVKVNGQTVRGPVRNRLPSLRSNVKVWVSSNYSQYSSNNPYSAADAVIKDFEYTEDCGNVEPVSLQEESCPLTITWGGGSQIYRLVEDSPTPLPCVGDIDRCVYTAHRKFYCMNGNKPDYTPFELNPIYEEVVTRKDVKTYAGSFANRPNEQPGTWFNTTHGEEPLISIKLFPNDYARGLVWGGFILKTYQRGGGVTTFRRGFTDQLSYARNTYIYLDIGEVITEVSGYVGAVINLISFGVTPNPVNPENKPTFHSVGGFGGGYFDATPHASLHGPCSLIGISGQTTTTAGGTEPFYIKAAEFRWQCIGLPSYYV